MTSVSSFHCQRQPLANQRFVLRLSGELDLFAAPSFQEECQAVLREGCQELFIDLGDLQFIDSAGLASLTYGFIKAGQDGWSDSIAVGTIAAGVAVLAILVAWERWLTGRNRAGHGGSLRGGVIRPLIELRLFRSAGFTWGTTLSTLVSFAMFGIFFAMPLYFQEVRGVNAMGSGLRLLPMIGYFMQMVE